MAGTSSADRSTAIVTFEGALDHEAASMAKRRIVEAGREGPARMILDLSAITHVDSAGVSALMAGVRRTGLRAKDVSLVCTDPAMLAVLEVTRVDRLLRVHASIDSAIAAGRER